MPAPILPENILKLMKPEDRAALGKAGKTAAEAIVSFEAQSERDVQKAACALLNLRRIVFSCPAMHKRSTIAEGWPDITFAIDGRACAWECKTQTCK